MSDLNGDNRRRAHYSEILWVITGKSQNGSKQFGIQKSIERIVYSLDGYSGLYVTYDRHHYPLHSKKEFEDKVKEFISSDCMYFSNCHGFSQDVKRMRMVSTSSFIYEHEMGPMVA